MKKTPVLRPVSKSSNFIVFCFANSPSSESSMGIINLVRVFAVHLLSTFYSKVSSCWADVQADLFLPGVHI